MTFQAVRVDKTEAGQNVRFVEMDERELMEGDVTVRVTHSTVNYKDGLALSGQSAIPRRFPLVLGIDLAGVVESFVRIPDFRAGDEVLAERLRPRRDPFWRLCRKRAGQRRLAGQIAARLDARAKRWPSGRPAIPRALRARAGAAGRHARDGPGGRHRRGGRRRLRRDRAAGQGRLDASSPRPAAPRRQTICMASAPPK